MKPNARPRKPQPNAPDSPAPVARHGRGIPQKEAAEYLGVMVATLAKWRQLGIGPRYSAALGRDPRYHADDLDAFLWGNGLVSNSVEAKHVRRKRKPRLLPLGIIGGSLS